MSTPSLVAQTSESNLQWFKRESKEEGLLYMKTIAAVFLGMTYGYSLKVLSDGMFSYLPNTKLISGLTFSTATRILFQLIIADKLSSSILRCLGADPYFEWQNTSGIIAAVITEEPTFAVSMSVISSKDLAFSMFNAIRGATNSKYLIRSAIMITGAGVTQLIAQKLCSEVLHL